MIIPKTLLLWGGTAVLVFGFIILATVAFLTERAARKRFQQRLVRAFGSENVPVANQRPAVPAKGPSFIRVDPDDSWVDPLLCRLTSRKLMPRWLTRSQRIYMISAFVLSTLFIGWLCWFLSGLGWYVSAPIGLVAGWMALRWFFNFLRRGEEMRFLEAFPEALGIFVRMVRAGLPVPEAIRTVGHEGPNAVAGDFRRMSERLAIGDPVGDVLTEAARRIEIADFRFFVVAVNIQRETGGNLAATLDNLADMIRRRRAARQRAFALMSEVRASIAVLTGLPFVVGAFIFITNRPYAMILYTTDRGRVILAAAIMMLCFGLLVMRWIIKRTMGTM